jgi:sodium transport system permease protein
MNTILTIIRKELLCTFREKRTLISAIIIPALAVPLMIMGVTKLQKNLIEGEKNKKLKIAMVKAPADVLAYFPDSAYEKIPVTDMAAARDSVANESYDALLAFDPNFKSEVDSLHSGKISFYFKSTNLMVEPRVKNQMSGYEDEVLEARFKKLNLSGDIVKPVSIQDMDVASSKEQIGLLFGGFIPYFFIIFCFVGCMYPALDLITGEKEKGTIETLLTVPVSRFQILLGKTITIAMIGICAAAMTLAGVYMVLRLSDELPKEILSTISDILSVRFVLMLFSMLIPLSVFFAGLLSAIVVRANSFKEAQTYVTPMTFVVIIPAMIALMPGVKLNWITVWIPILNIALVTKEIIAGTVQYLHYFVIVFSLLALAMLAVWVSYRQFSNEKNILK